MNTAARGIKNNVISDAEIQKIQNLLIIRTFVQVLDQYFILEHDNFA